MLTDGHPLMRVQPEPEAAVYARLREEFPDEESQQLWEEFQASDGTTYTLEEILAGLPDRQAAA